MPIFGKVPKSHLFDDELSWEVPDSGHHQVEEVPHPPHNTSSSPMVHHGKDVGDTHI